MTMRIERIEVQDFKKLQTVDITTDGDVITIGGKNAQGKSSLQDAIWNTLAGKQAAVTEPIRQGQSKATATITLAREDGTGLVATRTWKGERSVLTLKVKGGKMNLDEPQTRLNQILGPFTFDPMAFATMKDKDRRDALVELVGVDVSEFDAEIKRLTEERLLAGRDKRRVEGALGEAQPPASGLPKDFVSLGELSEQMRNVERVTRGIETSEVRIDEINQQLNALQAESSELSMKVIKAHGWLEGQPSLAKIGRAHV